MSRPILSNLYPTHGTTKLRNTVDLVRPIRQTAFAFCALAKFRVTNSTSHRSFSPSRSMETSSSSSYSRRQLHSEKFLSKRIAPAIVGKSCPICLNHIDYRRAAVITVCMHAYCMDCIQKWSNLKRNCPLCNSYFDSWFFKISLSSRSFHKLQLPALNDLKKFNSEDLYGRRSYRPTFQS